MKDISIIIVNWNTQELLYNCLSSLYQHTKGIFFEVFVVDNGSSDGSPEMVAQHFSSVNIIRNHANLGFAKANNQALLEVSGRYILLLNSDTELINNAPQEMAAFMEQHPTVGIAGTQLLNPNRSRQYSCDRFPRRPLVMLRDKIMENLSGSHQRGWQERLSIWDFDENFMVDYVIGAALMIRRETLEQIGLLDEQFFMYAEDIDWCYRTALEGWETYYLGRISIYHHNRGSSEKSSEAAARLQYLRKKNLLKFYRKHYGILAACTLRIILFLKTLLKK